MIVVDGVNSVEVERIAVYKCVFLARTSLAVGSSSD